MCSAYVWPRSVQGQGQSFSLNLFGLYILYLFANNSAQMSSMMSWCALHMFGHGQFKVMVKVKGWILYDCITCPLYNSWKNGDTLKWFGTNVKYHVIALVYDFTFLYKKCGSIQWHTGEDMIAYVSESTHLVTICINYSNIWKYGTKGFPAF